MQTIWWYDAVKWCNARSQQAGRAPLYYTDTSLTQLYTNGLNDLIYVNWAANGYALPTEAQWEKAARGGLSGQSFPWGNVISESLANYWGCSSGCGFAYDLGPNNPNPVFSATGTNPAGYFAPNGYGLFDMAGNVFEWCWDWYGTGKNGSDDYQANSTNPTGPATGSNRVVRGCAWDSDVLTAYASSARCANRSPNPPGLADYSIGFRCVRGL